jgi:hypothetical protein
MTLYDMIAGFCCKKKHKIDIEADQGMKAEGKSSRRMSGGHSEEEMLVRDRSSSHAESINRRDRRSGSGEDLLKDGETDGKMITKSVSQRVEIDPAEDEEQIEEIEDNILLKIIEESGIKFQLDKVKETLDGITPEAPLVKISKESDPLDLYFAIVDSEVTPKEKHHKFLSFYTIGYDPKFFVLRNCLLSAEERLASNPNLESYLTVARQKIGDTYYMVNHAVFKKVLMMSQRESLMIKAFKFLDNGDCIEHNMSVEYPSVPENPKIQRIYTLSNPIYYEKTETGLNAKSYNYVNPKMSMAFMILKPIMNLSYNSTFTKIKEIIENEPIGTAMDLDKIF